MIALIVKSTLITIAMHAIVWVLRRASASTRHLVLAAGFAALVALPAASALLPPLTVDLPIVLEQERTAGRPSVTDRVLHVLPFEGTAVAVHVHKTAAGASRRFRLSGGMLMAVVWLSGVLVSLAPLVLGLWQSIGARRRSAPWLLPGMLAPVFESRLEGGRVELRVDERVTTPMTSGALSPVVILPADVDSWSHQDLRRAMIHELEHVRRGDCLTLCLTRIVCAAYWFNPLVWRAWSRLRLEAERSCDDAVLRDGEPIGYADQLVTLAQRQVRRQLLVTMASPDDLSVRIGAMLDATERRGAVGVRQAAAVLLTALGLVSAIAVVRAQPAVRAQTTVPEFVALTTARTDVGADQAADARRRPESWLMHWTEHFVLYYLPEFAADLDSMASAAEGGHRELQADLGWTINPPLPIILVRDRSEASIESAQAAAPFYGNRLLVPMNLTAEARAPFFRHELTHILEFERLWTPAAGWNHWLFEGLAGYEEGVWSASDREALRTLIHRGGLPSLTAEFKRPVPLMTPAAAPGLGHALFEFMEARFGRDRVRDFLSAWSAHVLDNGADPFEVLRIAPDAFDREFAEFLQARFGSPRL